MKKIIKISYILLLLILTFYACEKWDLDTTNFVSVKTGSIVQNTFTTTTLQSEISGLQNGKIEEHGHLYSFVHASPELGQTDVVESLLGIIFEDVFYTNTLTNLTLNTTYYIRAFVILEGSTNPVYGEVVEVRLGDNELQVTTDSVIFFSGGFEMHGALTGLQEGLILSRYGFVFSNENETPSIDNDPIVYLGERNSDGNFANRFENVETLKNYHVRAFAQLGNEVFYGETKSFFKGDVWTQRADIIETLSKSFYTALGDHLYVGGRSGVSTVIQKYTPATDIWEVSDPFNGVTLVGGAAFGIGDIVYVATGTGDIGSDLWAYNTIDETWSQQGTFPGVSRRSAIVTAIQGKGYVGMGYPLGTFPLYTDIWVYDPAVNLWSEIEEFPGGGRINPVVFSSENELYIGLESSENPFQNNKGLWSYNVETQVWTEKSPLPAVDFFPLSLGGFRIGRKAYAVSSLLENNFWEYNLDTDKWTLRADYPGLLMFRPVSFSINGKGYYGLGPDIEGNGVFSNLWEYIPDMEVL